MRRTLALLVLLLGGCAGPHHEAVRLIVVPVPTVVAAPTTVTTALKVLAVVSHQARPRAARTENLGTRNSVGLNWAALRGCENGGSYGRGTSWPTFYGAYQFAYGTWLSNGGTKANWGAATPAEQDANAMLLFSREGRRPWPICGRLL